MKILLHLFFLMLFIFFSEAGKAQRTIEVSDPDYDKSYAMHNLMYDIWILRLDDYSHFSNFFSKNAKAKKIKEIKKRIYRKDSLSKDYKLGSIQITKFKKGFLSEEIEIEYLKNRFTGNAISVPDTIKWIVYTRKGYVISVLEKENAHHPLIFSGQERPIKTYYFGKSKKLDSIIISSKDESRKQFYDYDTKGRLIASNKFSIEYSALPAINRLDSACIDSLKGVILFDYLKKDLAGPPDNSFSMHIKAKELPFNKEDDSAYNTSIINFKGSYAYSQSQFFVDGVQYKFLTIYQLNGHFVNCKTQINLYNYKKDKHSSLQYYDYRLKGKKGIRTNYHTNYYLETDGKEIQEVDIETGNFEANTYKVLYEVVR